MCFVLGHHMRSNFLLRKRLIDDEVIDYFRNNTFYIVKLGERNWKFSLEYDESFSHKEGFLILFRYIDYYAEFVVADNIDYDILYYCSRGKLTFNLKAEVLKIFDKVRNLELFIATSSLPIVMRRRREDPSYNWFI